MSDLFIQNSVVTTTSGALDFLSISTKAKELGSEIDWVISQKKLEYVEDLLVLSKHKSVQVRRKVATGIGLLGGQDIIQMVKEWQVQESDRQTWLILESSIDKIQRKLNGDDDLEHSIHILTVTEAVNQIKRLVGEKTYIIEGEISEVKAVQQMYYFALKDSQDSRIDCGAFVGRIIKAGFPLNEGLSVRITGRFKIGKFSRLYLDVEKIQLTGEGELLRNLKLLEEKLRLEGLFDENRKRQIPKIPKNILLIASNNSAALTDYTKVLEQRIGGINIYHLPIKTQGSGAEYEIIESLKSANQLSDKFSIDTVVLTRGGGSKDDLFVFNSENVVRALHAVNRPTIVAIGHERDFTLAEYVADLRASTPSQAAELSSMSRVEIQSVIDLAINYTKSYFSQRKERYISASDQLVTIIKQRVYFLIIEARSLCKNIDNLASSFIHQLTNYVSKSWQIMLNIFSIEILNCKQNISQFQYIQKNLINSVWQEQLKLDSAYSDIYKRTKQSLFEAERNLQICFQTISLSNPKIVLERGYAIVRQGGAIVDAKTKLLKNKEIEIEFGDGKTVV